MCYRIARLVESSALSQHERYCRHFVVEAWPFRDRSTAKKTTEDTHSRLAVGTTTHLPSLQPHRKGLEVLCVTNGGIQAKWMLARRSFLLILMWPISLTLGLLNTLQHAVLDEPLDYRARREAPSGVLPICGPGSSPDVRRALLHALLPQRDSISDVRGSLSGYIAHLLCSRCLCNNKCHG